jgi:hypothetical protein
MTEAATETMFEFCIHVDSLKQKFFRASNNKAIQGILEFRGGNVDIISITETVWFGSERLNDGTISILDKNNSVKDQGNFEVQSGGGWADDTIKITDLTKPYSMTAKPDGSVMVGIHASYLEEGDRVQFRPAPNPQ